jgi:CheY-like chemotaxis protein
MRRLSSSSPNFADCLTVGEAAEFLGVSTATLRNWDRTGKLKPRRHPQNGYRIYLHEELEAVLRSADLSTLADDSFAPQVDWTKMRDSEHFVQFYENDEYLIESVSGYVAAALSEGDSSIVIASPGHRHALQRELVACGIDVTEAQNSGRYVLLDALETLSKFMIDGSPDPQRFDATIGTIVRRLRQCGRRVHAFGEMVALLWSKGLCNAAIELEQLWNKLASREQFALFCAYPIGVFNEVGNAEGFQGICTCHSRVIPAESYAAVDTVDKRLRAITLLQQKAQSLEAEIEHRREVEKALVKRERELADFFENAQRTQPAANDKAEMAKFRILVVDDNRDSGHTLAMLLRVKGHEVRMATDGMEAIAAAEEFRPDVILMDVSMPKLNGYEATRRIRQTDFGKGIMIVALTGWGQASDVALSTEAGCSAHLVKPVDFAELDQLLATVKNQS